VVGRGLWGRTGIEILRVLEGLCRIGVLGLVRVFVCGGGVFGRGGRR
jgi:hypothetical protein